MKIICLCLSALLLFAAPMAAAAAPPGEGTAETAAAETLSYTQPFSQDHYMKGLFAQGNEYFQVGNWSVTSAVLTLEYAVTPLLREDIADVTILLNGEPFFTFAPERGEGRRTIEIPMPVETLLADSGNALVLETNVRSSADNCADDAGGSNWLNIYRESAITMEYTPLNVCDVIGDFYKCFTSLEALDNGWSGVRLNPSPTAAEMTVAANAAAGVSANAVLFYEAITVSLAETDAELAAGRYGIYVSAYENLSETVRAALSGEQRAAAEGGAALALVKLGECNLLVVTGTDEAALLNAGTLLGNKLLMPAIRELVKPVLAEEDYTSPPYLVEQYLPLSETGMLVEGTFRQNASFYIDYPANRLISPSSELSLDLRYSDNLDFDRSLVTVFINDEPVGSKKLSEEKADGDTLELTFPEDVELTGTFGLRVAFDLSQGDEWCRTTPDDFPWGYVAETSMLKIASMDLPYFDFADYPSPFLRDGSFNDTLILLPENPLPEEIEAAHNLVLTLGRYLKDNRGSLSVAFYGTAELNRKNVIAIGESGRNPLFYRHKALLPIRYSDSQELLLSDMALMAELDFEKAPGVGEIIYSPDSEEPSALLILSGADSDAMLRAAAMLSSEEGLWQLWGDAFLADDLGNASCMLVDTDRAVYEMPASEPEEAAPVTAMSVLTVAAVGLLFLLAIVLVILKHRRQGS